MIEAPLLRGKTSEVRTSSTCDKLHDPARQARLMEHMIMGTEDGSDRAARHQFDHRVCIEQLSLRGRVKGMMKEEKCRPTLFWPLSQSMSQPIELRIIQPSFLAGEAAIDEQ